MPDYSILLGTQVNICNILEKTTLTKELEGNCQKPSLHPSNFKKLNNTVRKHQLNGGGEMMTINHRKADNTVINTILSKDVTSLLFFFLPRKSCFVLARN